MNYLLTQIFFCLLAAFILGAILGWLWRHVTCKHTNDDVADLQNEINSLKQKLHSKTTSNDDKSSTVERDNAKNDEANNTIKSLENEITGLQQKLKKCESQLQETDSQINTIAELTPDNKMTKSSSKDVTEKQKLNAKPKTKAKAKAKTTPKAKPKPKVKVEAKAKAKEQSATKSEIPMFLSAPRNGKADELKRIKGIGKVLEGILFEKGVYHFDQIASWSVDNAKWMDTFMKFPGRIEREGWIKQAKLLAKGKSTEFSKKVDKNKIYD